MSVLNEIRKRQGITRRELAIRMGVTERTIFRLEDKPVGSLKRWHLLALADALRVPLDELTDLAADDGDDATEAA